MDSRTAALLTDAVGQFGNIRAAVLGDVMLDVYDFCNRADSKPIDSEARGKLAYQAHESIKVLGGAGNVAANLAALGAQTSLVGVGGDDGNLVTLARIADASGIAHTLLADPQRPTTTKTRIYIDSAYQFRRDDEVRDRVAPQLTAQLEAIAAELIENVDVVVLSDYDKGFFTEALGGAVVRICSEREVPVLVDFKPSNASCFCGATVIAPNEGEADILLPGFAGASDPLVPLRELHQQLKCGSTVVTLGERGLCGSDGSRDFWIGGHKVDAVDAVGCGDTVRATLALGIAAGLSVEHSCELANCAAAAIVRKRATATIDAAEVVEFVRSLV